MRARALHPGEPIAVVGVSGPVRRARIEKGIGWLLDAGHPVEPAPGLMARRGFLGGSDESRAADLNAAIGRDDLPAIFFARGGWGAARILDRIDLKALRARPRVLLGYSDVTTLFMALQRPGRPYPVRYGPTVSELGEPASFDRKSLLEALHLPSRTIEHSLRGCRVIRPGSARGTIVGGTLMMLANLLGTPYDVPWDGCLLFWEEVNEQPYQIDRMLHHLRLAGKLRNLAGMIVGGLKGCEARPPTPGLPMDEILLEATAGTRYPIITGFPTGHIRRKRTLLLGVPARMTAGRRLTLDAR